MEQIWYQLGFEIGRCKSLPSLAYPWKSRTWSPLALALKTAR